MELEPGTKANKAWAPDNLDNPTSKTWNSPAFANKPAVREALRPAKQKLEGYLVSDTPEEQLRHISFIPNKGWTFTPYSTKRTTRIQGMDMATELAVSESKATQWLQNYYTLTTRLLGQEEANREAQALFESHIAALTEKTVETPPVTSNPEAGLREGFNELDRLEQQADRLWDEVEKAPYQ